MAGESISNPKETSSFVRNHTLKGMGMFANDNISQHSGFCFPGRLLLRCVFVTWHDDNKKIQTGVFGMMKRRGHLTGALFFFADFDH